MKRCLVEGSGHQWQNVLGHAVSSGYDAAGAGPVGMEVNTCVDVNWVERLDVSLGLLSVIWKRKYGVYRM